MRPFPPTSPRPLPQPHPGPRAALVSIGTVLALITGCGAPDTVSGGATVTVTAPKPYTPTYSNPAGYLGWFHDQGVPDTADLNDSALRMGYSFCEVLADEHGVDAATAALEDRGAVTLDVPGGGTITVRQIVEASGTYLCPTYEK